MIISHGPHLLVCEFFNYFEWWGSMKSVLVILFLMFAEISAAQNLCQNLFAAQKDFSKLVISKSVFEKYEKKISTLSPELAELFYRSEALDVLANDRLPLSRQRLMELMDKVDPQTQRQDLAKLLEAQLLNYVPLSQISTRVKSFVKKPSEATLLRVLGEKTLQETQELVYGADPSKPSPESLMGQYLAETQSLFSARKYPRGPEQNAPAGLQKYAVGIEAQHGSIFYKLFGGLPELLFHYHTPLQGTLYILFDRNLIAYAGGRRSNLEHFSANAGTILPMVVLSTSEAQRLVNYFSLGSLNYSFSKVPWQKLPKYCARGGYDSCTHWFGEMPVGDLQVTSYKYPGGVDKYADQTIGAGPQQKKLREYRDENYRNILSQTDFSRGVIHPRLESVLRENTETPWTNEDRIQWVDNLVQLVWTVPGSQHFAEMLGLQKAKLRGEFANPGYVAYSLIGNAKTARVPYVFHMINNESTEIPSQLSIHAY